jgi:phage terminase large subunit
VKIRLPNEFTPHPFQRRYMAYFDGGGKRAVWVVHRRGGKDLTAMHQTVKEMHRRRGAYWHVYPTFSQARKAIWEGFRADTGQRIIDNVFPPGIVKARNETEMKIELHNGSIWRLLGSDKIEVVGAGPVGVVFSEFALSKPRSADLISPMLMQNGGWASYITTPRGRNHAFKLYNAAKTIRTGSAKCRRCWIRGPMTRKRRLPQNGPQGDRKRSSGRSICAIGLPPMWAPSGATWLSPWSAGAGVLEFDHPSDGVFTSWDLGHTDATAIWFWRSTSTDSLT